MVQQKEDNIGNHALTPNIQDLTLCKQTTIAKKAHLQSKLLMQTVYKESQSTNGSAPKDTTITAEEEMSQNTT
jgi:hypothetical protein